MSWDWYALPVIEGAAARRPLAGHLCGHLAGHVTGHLSGLALLGAEQTGLRVRLARPPRAQCTARGRALKQPLESRSDDVLK